MEDVEVISVIRKSIGYLQKVFSKIIAVDKGIQGNWHRLRKML